MKNYIAPNRCNTA